jgi:negative regulator of sigma-B (phosphoserine phosphatase)
MSATRRPPRPADVAAPMRVAHLSVPKAGEEGNGDRAVFRQDQNGRTLLGIVDALGHGTGAEEVALAAVARLASASLDLGIGEIMEQVHAELRGSRGAAATLCLIAGASVQACGVGNVDFRCLETEIPFVLSPGILGTRVARFRVCTARTVPASRLIFFSDGVAPINRFDDLRKLAPADACRAILDRHRRKEDDATVLVADLG